MLWVVPTASGIRTNHRGMPLLLRVQWPTEEALGLGHGST